MKTQGTRVRAALAVSILSAFPAFAQTEDNLRAVERALSGQKILVTYRDGGPIYGTYHFMEVHFCASGRYRSAGESRKQTVMENEQVSGWRDSGVWDLAPFQGQLYLRYASDYGKRDAVPIRLLRDGSFGTREGVTMVRRGPAMCR